MTRRKNSPEAEVLKINFSTSQGGNMRNIVLALIFFLFFANEIKPQVVLGKLVDEYGEGLSSIFLQLYINPNVYNTTSLSDGSFVFDNI